MNTVKMWEMKDGDSREESRFHVKSVLPDTAIFVKLASWKPPFVD
jgi:hypothetical protein